MIHASFEDGLTIRLTVQGHGIGEYGNDLICAGTSTLVTTLANWMLLLHAEGKLLRQPEIRLEPGDAVIDVRPKAMHWETVRSYFGFVLCGLDGLREIEPQAIEIDIPADQSAEDMDSPT